MNSEFKDERNNSFHRRVESKILQQIHIQKLVLAHDCLLP